MSLLSYRDGRLVRPGEWAIVGVGAVLLAVVLTWPAAWRFGSAGRVDSGDGRFSIWNVAWVAHALTTRPVDLFQANIFFPHPNALAYSEANLVAGALAVPVWLATGNPYAAHNWVLVCSFALSGLATYALARQLTGRRAASALAGVAFAFCPYAFAHTAHVQLLMTFVIPVALLALHRFADAPSLAHAVTLGCALALAALACGYYGVIAGLSTGLGVLWFGLSGDRPQPWSYWAHAGLAAIVAALIVAPFFVPYVAVRGDGFLRTLDEARVYSVGWRSYLASPMFVHRWMLPLIGHWREVLFPGFLALVLAAVAVVAAVRGVAPIAPRATLAFYVALAGLGLWASLGPDAGLYAWLYRALPVFTMLRAPARFGVLVTLAMAVLAAIGLATLERRTPTRLRPALYVAVAVLAFLQAVVVPLPLVEAPPTNRVYKYLRTLPWGPVVEFPYFSGEGNWPRQTSYMLMSAVHFKPLLNGYSDHIPPTVREDAEHLAAFPGGDSWRVLRNRKARYVVVHWNSYSPERARSIRALTDSPDSTLRAIVHSAGVSLFEVAAWPAAVAH